MPKLGDKTKDPEPAGKAGGGDESGQTRMELATLEEATETINILYYGEGGTGKTTDLATMANFGRILFVNAEAGVKRRPLKERGVAVENIVLWPPKGQEITFQGLEDLYWQIKSDLEDDPESWIGTVWDSLTEIYKKLLDGIVEHQVRKAERAGKDRDRFFIDRADYGVMTEQIRLLIRRFRDLPCHFGAAALERRDLDDDGSVKYGPALTPGLQNDVNGYMDVVIHTTTTAVGEDLEYRGQTANIGKYYAKDRYGALPRWLVDPTFERVAQYVNDELDEESDPIMIEARKRNEGVMEEAKAKAE